MIPIVGVSLEEALLGFGGDDDAELHDKEVTLTTSDVTGSQTAIFEYDPQNEPTTGTPAGPWDGYSLFTIDLSAVKDDIEDLQQQIADLEDELEDCHDCKDEVVAFIQQYIPDYDPQPDECPADEMPALVQAVQPTLGSKFITANGTYLPASDNLDGYNQVVVDVPTWESCIQAIAAKLGVQEPYDCEDITDAIDEKSGFEPPIGTPIEDIIKIMGSDDTVEIEGNTYHFDYYVWERNTDVHYPLYTLFEGTPQQSYSVAPQMNVYDSDGQLVATEFIAGTQSQGVPNGYKYQVTSATIDYSNKLLIVAYQVIDNWGNVITGTENNDISAYLDTTSPNPQYKVKNS